MLELQHLAHCLYVTTELLLTGILPANHSFSDAEMLSFLQRLFSFDEETHVSLNRKPDVLEAEASSKLFLCEN
jgi:hypothetical protein